jgi:hypothetical protein
MELLGSLNASLEQRPYIYRIELLERFRGMLRNKELVFVRPGCWSDPLENIIYNATMLRDGKTFEHPAKKDIYGQCWSYEGDSYGLWQIYTTKPDNRGRVRRHPGVRITTHLDRLQQITANNSGSFYCGVVEYKWKKDLLKLQKDKEFIKGLKVMDLNADHLKTLLVKRYSYAYENEFRLLGVPAAHHRDSRNDMLCRLKIEPCEFISSIRFDPAMEHDEFKRIKQELVNKYGFAPTRITRSTLNNANGLVIDLDQA